MGEVADAVFGQNADELSAALAWVGALALRLRFISIFRRIPIWPSDWERIRLSFPGKLRLSVYFKVSDGILEKMAYFTFHLVPRLHIHSLGGSYCSGKRQIFNMFVVWACTGMWHAQPGISSSGVCGSSCSGWRKIPLGKRTEPYAARYSISMRSWLLSSAGSFSGLRICRMPFPICPPCSASETGCGTVRRYIICWNMRRNGFCVLSRRCRSGVFCRRSWSVHGMKRILQQPLLCWYGGRSWQRCFCSSYPIRNW